MNVDKHKSILLLTLLVMTQTVNCTDNSRVVEEYGVTQRSIEERYAGVIPWESGMTPGSGFDSLSLKVKTAAHALDFDVDNPDHYHEPVCHYDRRFNYRLVETREELELELGLLAGAKLDLVIASLKGTVEFINSIRFNKKNIYILIEDYRLNCEHRIKNPTLKEDAKEEYVKRPGLFHYTYGDKFLNSVTTGGVFFGLAEIECDSLRHKMEIEAKLKAKAFGITVAKFTWHKVLKDALQAFVVRGRIHVLVNNAEPTFVTIGEFFGVPDQPGHTGIYEKFLKTVTAPECNGASKLSYRQCPFLVGRFEDYAAIARSKSPMSVGKQIAYLTRLTELHSKYKMVRKELAVIEENPTSYVFLDSGQATGSSNTEEKIAQLVRRTEHCLDLFEEHNAACQQYVDQCETDVLGLCPDSLVSIKRDFPERKRVYPKDCHELKELKHCDKDGEYTVYWEGSANKPYEVFCDFVEPDEDNPNVVRNPDTYLTLKKISPASERPSYNFSQFTDVLSKDGTTVNSITSVYQKIKVIMHEDKLYLDPNQQRFVKTIGDGVTLLDVRSNTIVKFTRATFAHAYSCHDSFSQLRANIDLRGTPFVLAKDTAFENLLSSEKSGQTTRDNAGKIVNLFLFSRGGCTDLAAVEGLQLVYNKAGD